VGTQPAIEIADFRLQIADYCREIEAYLCRKNDGHLIRVVGPSFDIVSRWAEQGVPLKVACEGIDRYFARYYRKGPRRRPVKIDFCEADVLDVFDEWRRAVGVISPATPATPATPADPESRIPNPESLANPESRIPNPGSPANPKSRIPNPESPANPKSRIPNPESLPSHLERVVMRLSAARARGSLGEAFDALIDRVAAELDAARARAGGLRGGSRHALLDRLSAIDAELLQQAGALLDDTVRAALRREADEELAGFRAAMSPEAFARAQRAAMDRLVRERFGLPTIGF
jgi:hypothetical protein